MHPGKFVILNEAIQTLKKHSDTDLASYRLKKINILACWENFDKGGIIYD